MALCSRRSITQTCVPPPHPAPRLLSTQLPHLGHLCVPGAQRVGHARAGRRGDALRHHVHPAADREADAQRRQRHLGVGQPAWGPANGKGASGRRRHAKTHGKGQRKREETYPRVQAGIDVMGATTGRAGCNGQQPQQCEGMNMPGHANEAPWWRRGLDLPSH